MYRTTQLWRRQPWLSVVLFAALVSRILVPQGFMPGHGGLILCPAYAPGAAVRGGPLAPAMSDMTMDDTDVAAADIKLHGDSGGGAPHSPDDENDGICPFAAAASNMAPIHARLAAFRVFQLASTIPLHAPAKIVPRGTIVPTRLPRGPPDLV